VKVLICDDHTLFNEMLTTAFGLRGFDVVGCVSHPKEAVDFVNEQQVDVCVMDVRFPGGTSLEAIRSLVDASARTKVVVLTGLITPAVRAAAHAAGASACMLKSERIATLAQAINDVHDGVDAGIDLRDEPREPRAQRASAQPSSLTRRELEVLTRMAHGETAASMAKSMGISYATARTHTQHILTKLSVHSRVEAVAYAISHSLVEVDPAAVLGERAARRQEPAGHC